MPISCGMQWYFRIPPFRQLSSKDAPCGAFFFSTHQFTRQHGVASWFRFQCYGAIGELTKVVNRPYQIEWSGQLGGPTSKSGWTDPTVPPPPFFYLGPLDRPTYWFVQTTCEFYMGKQYWVFESLPARHAKFLQIFNLSNAAGKLLIWLTFSQSAPDQSLKKVLSYRGFSAIETLYCSEPPDWASSKNPARTMSYAILA